MIVKTGDITQEPAPGGRGVIVNVPVELLVAAGFARPSRNVQATVRVQILGFLNGDLSASAVVHDRNEKTPNLSDGYPASGTPSDALVEAMYERADEEASADAG